jgi:arabinofuranosyltransferase
MLAFSYLLMTDLHYDRRCCGKVAHALVMGEGSPKVENSVASGAPSSATLLKVVSLLVCALVLFRHAWVSDDAFITLRTVRNLLDGSGLRWNLYDRVQGYTHPLWMLLLALSYSLLPDPMGAPVVLSLGLSMLTLYWIAFRMRLPAPASLLALAILISSKSFVDYATSGLENPLTHFLFVLLLTAHLHQTDGDRVVDARARAQRMVFLAGLLALNRLDAFVVAIPFLVPALWRLRGSLRGLVKVLGLGFAPLLVWETFAVVYYGFPFPNTAYAKLASGIPSSQLWLQGVFYYLSQIDFDPVSLLVIAFALVLFAVQRERRLLAPVLGVLLYLGYLVWIGGDFMAGRFFSLPLLAAALVLAYLLREALDRSMPIAYVPAAVVLAAGLLLTPHPTLGRNVEYALPNNPISANYWDERGVCDERGYYAASSSILHASRTHVVPDDWRRARGQRMSATGIEAVAQVGVTGFFAPATAILVDGYGLNDAFLARLPATDQVTWRVGHYGREIPSGYLESLRAGRNRMTDPKLGQLFERVRLVVSGPIWSWERWKEIVRLNLGLEPPPLVPAAGRIAPRPASQGVTGGKPAQR